MVIGTILMGVWLNPMHIFGKERSLKTEVQMKSSMAVNFMAQFVSFIDGVAHLEKDVFAVSYPVLLILMLTRSSMPTLVSF